MKRAHIDIVTAFLSGILEEDIWVMSPRGIDGQPCHCYKLKKAIYGLKQAHRMWHRRLCNDLEEVGFVELPSAPCLFRLKDHDFGGDVFLLLYVDDILILSDSDEGLDYVIRSMKKLYELRASDDINWFLGVQLSWKLDVTKQPKSLHLSQPLYTEGALRRFGMIKSKPVSTPMVESFWSMISQERDRTSVEVKTYEQIIGSLLYLALRTRPDILPSVLILAKSQKAPTAYCDLAAKRVLRYLRGTTSFGIQYAPGSMEINGFVDSDYAGDTVDRRSMTGYLVKFDKAVCIWGSKRQATVALSTCEAEYTAISLAAKDMIWSTRLIDEFGIGVNYISEMQSDNQSAIDWATSEQPPSTRAKHIDVKVHFIRDRVNDRTLAMGCVPTELYDSDVLTKPLGKI